MNVSMMVNFVFLLFLILYVYFVVKKTYEKLTQKSHKYFLALLVLEHFVFMLYGFYITENTTSHDAYRFYSNAQNGTSWFALLLPGSNFFTFLIYPFVKAGVSMFSLFVCFSVISLLAFLKYFEDYTQAEKKSCTIFNIPPALWILLLPSFHLWSGLLGKDALFFYFLTYLLFEIKSNKIYTFSNAMIMMLMLLLRPHFFLVVFGVFFIYVLIQKTISARIKLLFLFFSTVLVFISFPIVKFFLHFKDFSLQSIDKLVKEMNFLANTSGSGVGFDETNYVERVWLLLFRPLFFDAENNLQIWISVENTIVLLFLIFTLVILFKKPRALTSENFKLIYFSIGISIGLVLLISSYIYNLGLASRMRLMFYPLLIYGLHRITILQNKEK